MKLLSIAGARPQFVKAAILHAAIRRYNRQGTGRIKHCLVHTGQHYDRTLSDIFFDELPLPKPDHCLGVGSAPHGAQTAAMLEGSEAVLLKERPDIVIVYGDTNSTIAGSLAASKLHIPVAHVEAGLRSYNRRMPEELNRVATDHLSDFLFCPTVTAVRNLRREGITRGIFLTGDVMLDAVQRFRRLAERRTWLLSKLGIKRADYVLVTVHRAENTDCRERLMNIVEALRQIKRPIVFPMHPRVRDRLMLSQAYGGLRRALDGSPELHLTAPVSYLDMLFLEENARVVLTDSGGVQKESYFLGTPCLTLREETEWLETLSGGWNQLVGTSPGKIVSIMERLWLRRDGLRRNKPALAKFGRGDAGGRVVRILAKQLLRGKPSSEVWNAAG